MQTGHFVYIFTSNLHAYSSDILNTYRLAICTHTVQIGILTGHIFGMHTDKIFHMDIAHVFYAQTDLTLYFAHTP